MNDRNPGGHVDDLSGVDAVDVPDLRIGRPQSIHADTQPFGNFVEGVAGLDNIGSIVLSLFVLSMILTSCSQPSNNPAQIVEKYLGALVEKNASSLASLSCADWEPMALLELDSLQAVDTRLDGLSCPAAVEETDGTFSVHCTGRLLATYNNEDQEIDLSSNTYIVVKQGGEYLVCGYR